MYIFTDSYCQSGYFNKKNLLCLGVIRNEFKDERNTCADHVRGPTEDLNSKGF